MSLLSLVTQISKLKTFLQHITSVLPAYYQHIGSVYVQYLSSICPVYVQYLSSDTLEKYCRISALKLKSNCTYKEVICCLYAVYALSICCLCAVCVLVVRRKSWTKWGGIVSKPSRRHPGTISKECKRIGIEKTIYNLAPVHCSPSAIVELRSLVLRRRGRIICLCLLLQNIKSKISNFKYQISMFKV